MFESLTHKSFFVNLLVAMSLVAIIILIFFGSLGFITHHNDNQKVPSVTGKVFDEAKKVLELSGFDVVLQDSIYTDTAAPLAVMRQSPEADAIVKANRTVYLTVNRSVPPLVVMPDLRGFSVKSAELYLHSIGLKMGDTSYVPDIARNAVREQKVNGNNIDPGTKVNMGTAIDLVIGNGIGNDDMDVPDLVGMTVDEARSLLSNNHISIGAILAMDALKDTATAFIVKQSPEPKSIIAEGTIVENKIRPGEIMDIWISPYPPVKDTTMQVP